MRPRRTDSRSRARRRGTRARCGCGLAPQLRGHLASLVASERAVELVRILLQRKAEVVVAIAPDEDLVVRRFFGAIREQSTRPRPVVIHVIHPQHVVLRKHTVLFEQFARPEEIDEALGVSPITVMEADDIVPRFQVEKVIEVALRAKRLDRPVLSRGGLKMLPTFGGAGSVIWTIFGVLRRS